MKSTYCFEACACGALRFHSQEIKREYICSHALDQFCLVWDLAKNDETNLIVSYQNLSCILHYENSAPELQVGRIQITL